MQDLYYIKREMKGNIYGPFTREEVELHLAAQRIHLSMLASVDQKTWATLDQLLKRADTQAVTRLQYFQSMSDIFPRPFGHYELWKELGRGGMGIVYQAKDMQLGRIVALKVMREEGRDPIADERFLKETEMNARLDHPGIVRIYERGTEPQLYMAMEFLEGRSLTELMKDGLLTIRQSVDLFYQICEAIDYAHRQKVIHRDIKPSNIMVLSDGKTKIMDFGIAKSVDSKETLTKLGDIMGTPQYMAPEQAQGKEIDRRVDVYSLGAMFYEMLTKRTPYEGNSVYQILLQASSKEPVLPRELNPDIPKDLQTICLKCLEKKPKNRYYAVKLLLKDLELFRANKPIRARDPNAFERSWKWMQRNKIAAIVMLMLLVSIVATALALRQSQLLQKKLVSESYKEGCYQFHQKQWKDALRSFEKAFSLQGNPQNSWMLGCTYFLQPSEKPQEAEQYRTVALEHWEHALQNLSDNVNPWDKTKLCLLQSLAYADQKQWKEAREMWDEARLLLFPQIKNPTDVLPALSEMNLAERLDFTMPFPDENLEETSARYYLLLSLLPEDEMKMACHLLATPANKETKGYLKNEKIEALVKKEFYKIGALLAKHDKSGWPKDLIAQGILPSQLKEMIYPIADHFLFNMASAYWTRVPAKQQGEWASFYQKAYAKERGWEVVRKFSETARYDDKSQPRSVTFVLVLIPPGQFLLGKPFSLHTDGPQGQVVIEEPFWMSQYETTQQQWLAVAKDHQKEIYERRALTPLKKNEDVQSPVIYISSWEIPKLFLKYLIPMHAPQGTPSLYALPNEIQWEYACRAGSTSLNYCGKNKVDDYVWYRNNALDPEKLEPVLKNVGLLKPNAWGLYDMAGNAAEFCSNSLFIYEAFFKKRPSKKDIFLEALPSSKVHRGGAIGSSIEECYSSSRGEVFLEHDGQDYNPVLGFRIIRRCSGQ